MFDALIKGLPSLPQVEAIVRGSSRAGIVYDKKSDYDIYLYCTAPISEEVREKFWERMG